MLYQDDSASASDSENSVGDSERGSEKSSEKSSEKRTGSCYVEQSAGDVLFVPRHWSHQVLAQY